MKLPTLAVTNGNANTTLQLATESCNTHDEQANDLNDMLDKIRQIHNKLTLNALHANN